jgi:hypothetical protein
VLAYIIFYFYIIDTIGIADRKIIITGLVNSDFNGDAGIGINKVTIARGLEQQQQQYTGVRK